MNDVHVGGPVLTKGIPLHEAGQSTPDADPA
jgi:hypothetical protein